MELGEIREGKHRGWIQVSIVQATDQTNDWGLCLLWCRYAKLSLNK